MTQNSDLLKSGIDHPKNWDQFIDWFHDEDACQIISIKSVDPMASSVHDAL
jgi:hypothetical protein